MIAKLHEGDSFGEMALVNDQPRMSTIVTLTPVELLVLEKRPYLSLLRRERQDRLGKVREK